MSYLDGRLGMQTWTSKGLALPSRSGREGRSRPAGLHRRGAGLARPWQFAPTSRR